MTIARTVRIEGKVQGVFFRGWAIGAARAIGVSGWIRNRLDGSVEAYVVGEGGLVDRFTDRLREGSPASRVDQVDIAEAPVHAYDGFTQHSTV